jgi:hypothetical protein
MSKLSQASNGHRLGTYLGRKDAQHVAAFIAVGLRAIKNHPRRCEGLKTSPPHERCRCIARIGSRFCVRHLSFDDQVALDNVRRPKLLKIVETSGWAKEREEAQMRLDAIERRAIRFTQIKVDPRIGPVLINFAKPEDRARCEEWLKAQGYPVDAPSPVSGELPSALCLTRCLFAAMRFLIKQNIDEQKAMAGIRRAHRLDSVFFDKLRALDERAG